jgi:hypothetical protein
MFNDYKETRGLLLDAWKAIQQVKKTRPAEYQLRKRMMLYLVLPLSLVSMFINYALGAGLWGFIAMTVFAIASMSIAIPIFFRFFPYDPGADQK